MPEDYYGYITINDRRCIVFIHTIIYSEIYINTIDSLIKKKILKGLKCIKKIKQLKVQYSG